MRNNKLIFLLLTASLITNVYFSFVINKTCNVNESIQSSISFEKNKNKKIQEETLMNYNAIYLPRATKIQQNIVLFDEKYDSITLDKFSFPLLVFRYSELDCNACVSEQLNTLTEFEKKNKKVHIILLASYNSLKSLIRFKRMNQLAFEVYNLKKGYLPFDSLNVPYYFVLDSTMQLKLPFISGKEGLDYSENYLNNISNSFF